MGPSENLMGILSATVCMVFAGLTDFLFKGYIRRPMEKIGNFTAGVGLVWAAVFCVPIIWSGGFNWRGWPISVAAGVTSLTANILFIAAMRKLDGGVSSTVYRLNLVMVVFLAAIFLNESLTGVKLWAVGLGVLAILLMFQRANDRSVLGGSMWGTFVPFFVVIVAALLRAVLGLLYKVGAVYAVGRNEFLMTNGLCWFVGGAMLSLALKEPLVPSRRGWRYSLLAGLIVCGNVYFLALAVTFGEASIVVPITQLGFSVAVLLNWLLLGERLTWKRIAALVSAGLCIVAMARA